MILRTLARVSEWLLIAMLALMVALVFGNVVLRYVFNSSIVFSEEMSRFLFVWVVFLGSVLTLRDNGHLGIHSLTDRLPLAGRKVCKFVGDLLTLGCCLMLIWGASEIVLLNLHNYAPITNIPLGYVYLAAVISGVGMAGLVVHSLYRLATGRMRESEMSSSFEDVL